MPRIATAVKDDILPAIFRRVRRGLVPGQGEIDDFISRYNDPHNIPRLPSEGQGVPLGNMLAPQEPAPIAPTAPVVIREDLRLRPEQTLADKYTNLAVPETTPSVQPAANVLAPVDLGKGSIYDPGLTTERTAKRVETDKRGRPIPNIMKVGDEQTLDYNARLARMPEDKEGGGWWPKIMAAIAGFAAGGPVGAAAAFGTRALREKLDPTLGSREYRAQKMGELAPAVESIQKRRKEERDIAKTEADIDYTKARTKALTDPKAEIQLVERTDGVYRIDKRTGKSEKVADIPEEAGPMGATRYFERPDGVYGVNNKYPDGFKVMGVPGLPQVEDDTSFYNQNITQAIRGAEAEQAKIDQALKDAPYTIEETNPLTGVTEKKKNPAFQDLENRRRTLDDKIREWRTELKAPKKRTMTPGAPQDDPLGIFDDE